MAFGSDNDIKIRVEIDNAGAVRVLDQTEKKIQEFGGAANEAVEEVEGLSRALKKSGSALDAVRGGFNELKNSYLNVRTALVDLAQVAQQAFGLIADGAQIAQAQDAFDRLAASAGTTAETLLGKLKEATDGTITNFQLLKIANDGLIAGLKPEELELFAKAADAVADSTGGDAAAGLQRLSDAFARGRVEGVAAELGIRNYNAEIKKVADAVGVTTDKLGEDARKLIERNILLDAVSKKTQELGVNTIVNGDIVERWGVALQNSADNLKTLLGRSTQLTAVLLGIERVGGEVATVFETLSSKIEKAAASTQKFNSYFKAFITGASPVGGVLTLLNDLGAEGAKKNELAGLFGSKNILGSGGAEGFARDTNLAEKSAKRLKETIEAVKKAMIATGEASKVTAKDIEKAGDAMVKLYKANKELTSFDGIQKQTRQFRDLFKSLSDGAITADQYGAFFTENIQNAIEAGISPDEIARRISSALSGAVDKIEGGSVSFADLFKKLVVGSGGSQAQADLAASIAPSLEGAFGTATDLAISALSGEDTTKLQRAKAIGAAVGAVIGAAIAGALSYGALAGVGAAIGSVIGEAIGSVIGRESKNAARKAKKAFDAALIEEFKKNPVQIVNPYGDFAERLKDFNFEAKGLDTEEYNEKLKALKDTLGNEVAGAFNTAAIALEQFAQELGINADQLRGGLFDVLLGNLGPNILNLKALFQSLGKDAEDVRGLLYKAFLQGAISASELLTLLRQIGLIFSDGIPTAIGAVDQAFKQFQALAGKGGASSFEALKALAVEALEAGATTFDQLANLLINQYGFAADQVNQLLQAMKLAGLNNLNDLAKASQETLLAVLANIQELLAGGTNFVTGAAFEGILPKPKSTGGGGDRVDEALEAAKATLAAVQATDEYRLAIDGLKTGELSRSQVQKIVNNLAKEYNEVTKARAKLEEHLAQILKKGGKITAEQAKQLQKLTEATENFGKVGEKGFRTVNKELLNFSKTVGNDLNKFILAANAAGVSFDELKKPIVDAFLAGKISASDAFKELQKYQQGLGGVGNTAREALDNLLKGGTSGGAFSLDALKDIAGEALKLGGQSILDLENQLRAQGVGDDRISQLLRAISDAGITSLDQLANANDETAIRIIAKAKEFGLPFQETGNEIKKLLDDLQKIRESPEVKVKVGLDASPGLKELLDLIAGRSRAKTKNPGRNNATQPNA